MWISEPTPVISSTKSADSGSSSSPKSTFSAADCDPGEQVDSSPVRCVGVQRERVEEDQQAEHERRDDGGDAEQVAPPVGAPPAEQQHERAGERAARSAARQPTVP